MKQQTGFFKNFNVTKYMKPFLAVSLAIVLLGAIMIGIFRYNLAYQYKGGCRITIQVDKDNLSNKAIYNDYVKKITEVIENLKDADDEPHELKVRASSLNKAKSKEVEIETDAIVFITTIQRGGGAFDSEFATRLNKELNNVDFKTSANVSVNVLAVGTEYQRPVDFADAFVNPLGFFILAAGLICVWFAFRYGIKDALITVYILFSDALVLAALLALTRIPFNVNFMALLAVMWLLSAVSLIFLFDRIKTIRPLPGYNKLDETGIAQAGFNESFKNNLYVFGLSGVAALALLIGTTDTMLFAVASFVSLLTGALNAVFVAPALYAFFKEGKKPVKRAPKAVPAKNQQAKPVKKVEEEPEEIKEEEQSEPAEEAADETEE